MTERAPILGLTMGDPAGIGPEIILKALEALGGRVANGELTPVVVGTASCIADAARQLGRSIQLESGIGAAPWPKVRVIEAATPNAKVEPGELCAEGGRLAYAAIERAIRLATDGEIDAIVTAPINKEALNAAGHMFAGHTEILTELTGSKSSCMLLVHDRLRVSHVTTHVALAEVPKRITPERLRLVFELTHQAMLDFGIATPRIGVAALNPHAGERGLFGREDDDVIRPVIEEFRARGRRFEGPVPGDTVFVKALGGQFDAVVAMYHDQGHVAVKTLGFAMDRATGLMSALSGVNVTLGLPIVRTSVDHGTAFDIAGRGIANPQSMLEAVEVAERMVSARRARG
jgi:4-hydroxythreonine-4-phosphate dehydrogenase